MASFGIPIFVIVQFIAIYFSMQQKKSNNRTLVVFYLNELPNA
jgi:hypothetical protein